LGPATSIDTAKAAIMIIIIVCFELKSTNGYILPVRVYQKCAYCYLSFVWIKVIQNVIINSINMKDISQVFVRF
jgi:hypothetical protein